MSGHGLPLALRVPLPTLRVSPGLLKTQTEENRLSSSVPANSYNTAVGCRSQLKTKQTENNNRRAVGTVAMPVIPALRKLWQNRFSVTVTWVTQRKTLSQKEVVGGVSEPCVLQFLLLLRDTMAM